MSGLDKLFEGAACKHLSAVDATPKSNQHEIGSNKFKVILGNPEGQKLRFSATFLLFTEDAEDPISLVDTVTYYDPRFGNPNRSPELRLYYRDNLVTEQIQEGDFCIIAKRTESAELLIAFARSGSVHEHRLRHLFKLDKPVDGWQISEKISDEEINLATRSILDALGIEVLDVNDQMLGHLLDKFGHAFPKTAIFSVFARELVGDTVDPMQVPDDSLEAWMRQEEILFRTLERSIVQTRIDKGFETVEDFVSFSLSVQNRRKSRVGHALENHLEAVLIANRVDYQRGVKTEGNAKPDFLFPNLKCYQNPGFASHHLRMLAAKSTCKDRWRQILTEAARIEVKHLFTLETAISVNQTEEMLAHKVQLVVPPSVGMTYTVEQQKNLLTLGQFIDSLPHKAR